MRGAAKGFDNQEATDFPLDDHHWCVVYVDGTWRLIDQSFGCTGIAHGITDWIVAETNLEIFRNFEEKKSEKKYRIGEESFLADPEIFIYTHFPAEEKMQLLARPVTHGEFNMMAKLNEAYFYWEIGDLSEPRANLATNTGQVEIWFKTKPGRDVSMSFVLLKHTDNIKDDNTDRKLNELVRLENKDGRKKFCLFFKNIGLFKLTIYIPTEENSSSLSPLVEYVIRCNCPYFPEVENPALAPGLQEIGPGAKWKSMGITTNTDGGIIRAYQGRACLQLKCRSNVGYTFQLKSCDENEENKDLLDQCILTETGENVTILYIRLPSHGTFLLMAFTGEKDEKDRKHTCNFLIESDMRCITGLFPKGFQKSVGAVNQSTLLQPIENGAYLYLSNKKEEFIIELSLCSDAFFMVKLLLCDDDQLIDLSEYTWFQTSNDLLRVFCRFRHAGEYIVKIFSKEDAAEKSYSLIWTYLLEVENPSENCQPYPETLMHWRQDMKLVSPKLKFLKQSSQYKFEVNAAGRL